MTLADAQQQRLLERLRTPATSRSLLASCMPAGLTFRPPSSAELELNGYAIERVYDHGRLVGVRMLHPEPPDTAPHTRRTPAAAGRSDSQLRALAITADGPGV